MLNKLHVKPDHPFVIRERNPLINTMNAVGIFLRQPESGKPVHIIRKMPKMPPVRRARHQIWSYHQILVRRYLVRSLLNV